MIAALLLGRKGSQGLPSKNLWPILNRPLAWYPLTAASAATFVNRIWEDPRSWWMSDDTQKARAIFCNRYARASSDWVDRWCDELTGVLSG